MYCLDFDNPDTDESQATIAPWDVTHQLPQCGPKCYKMNSQPRGLCLIINNADFAKSREKEDANNEARIQKKPLADRKGSYKDASMYFSFLSSVREIKNMIENSLFFIQPIFYYLTETPVWTFELRLRSLFVKTRSATSGATFNLVTCVGKPYFLEH